MVELLDHAEQRSPMPFIQESNVGLETPNTEPAPSKLT